MKNICSVIIGLVLIVVINGCHNNNTLTNKDVSKVICQMSAVMLHDVTNPPLAARFFAYTCLSGYEVVTENDKQVKSMLGKLNQYPIINKPNK